MRLAQQHQRIHPPSSIVLLEQTLEDLEQCITRLHPAVKFRNGGAAVPDPFLFDQHRAIGQPVATAGKLRAERVIRPPIPDFQLGQPAFEFRTLSECTAERAVAVVNEDQCHGRIVPCLF